MIGLLRNTTRFGDERQEGERWLMLTLASFAGGSKSDASASADGASIARVWAAPVLQNGRLGESFPTVRATCLHGYGPCSHGRM